MNIKIAHLESGLRSFDRTMPEEINRILTDEVADYFFVTEQSGIDNLIREWKNPKQIFFVGNTMIDTLMAFKSQIEQSAILSELNIEKDKFVLITIHRPATVDFQDGLTKLIHLINEVSEKYKIIFPIHPRTTKNLTDFNLMKQIENNKNLILTNPLDYFSFQKLIKDSTFILTDSGGIQEETTFLQVPCLTLRPNTERPCTISIGTNELIPFDIEIIKNKIAAIENNSFKKGAIPPLWDGKTTDRILDIIQKQLL